MRISRRKESWLIGIRLRGNLRSDVRDYMNDVQRDFQDKKRRYPHITLFGPFSTRMAERHLKYRLMKIAQKYPKARFSTDGFSSFDNSGWFSDGRGIIMIKIVPNEDLKRIRHDIAQELLPHCSQEGEYDRGSKNGFKFHATLAIGRTGKLFKDINKELKSYEFKHEDIKPELILYRSQAPVFAYLTGHDVTPTRPKNLYADPEINQPSYTPHLETNHPSYDSLGPLTDESRRRGKIFVVSDMHFDHKNIIEYCDRPFRSVYDMNRTLISNWNGRVRKGDRVYYLGDMAFGRKSIDFWLSRLNGEIRFIRGNHDVGGHRYDDVIEKAEVIKEGRILLKYDGHEFLLTHDPDRPPDWDGWIIHGDKHNNSRIRYPHIHIRNKTVNVCVEYTDYTPMNLDEIIAKISE